MKMEGGEDMTKNNAIFLALVALIIGGVGGFFGGMHYQKTQLPSFAGGPMGNGADNQMMMRNGERRVGFNNASGQGQQAMQFRPVMGEITSSDGKSITVKMQDGSSKIVVLSDKTEINKAEKVATSDLKTGEKVMVVGKENSDGSVTAQNIQLNPMTRFMQSK